MKRTKSCLGRLLCAIIILAIAGGIAWKLGHEVKEQKIVMTDNKKDEGIKEEADNWEEQDNVNNNVIEDSEKEEQQEDNIQQADKNQDDVQKDEKSQDKTDEVTDVNVDNEIQGEKPDEKQEQKVEEKTSFRLNDKDDMVKEIQKKLNNYGYNITIDGVFGDDTYYAVVDFQQRAGLLVDGVVGPATMEKLSLPPTDELMYKPKDETTMQPGDSEIEKFINAEENVSKTDYYIYTDTDNFSVYIFEGKSKNWKLIRTIKCSVGAPSTPTKKGHFTVGVKGPMFRVSKNIICKYYTQYSGNYLFHTVLLNNDGKVVDGRLGKRISHGCIRLAVEDAKYMYDNIPPGTAVWIK